MAVRGRSHGAAWTLTLAALGVVYGDIGTSPLYALRECFHGAHGIAPSPGNVLGVLSLIVWALIIVVTVKYLLVVLRADNHGEGGILALVALLCPPDDPLRERRSRWLLAMVGLFGAALLYGDGAITPAISVLSAVEGLEVAAPVLRPYVLPLAAVILTALFMLQRRGTQRMGALFGPVTAVWFVAIAVLGIRSIVGSPEILASINPVHAWRFFAMNGRHGFLILGAVFLVVTGAEALYADMGHFGRSPIRRAWLALVLPALLANYFGQGALLLREPAAAANPFFLLAPGWSLYGMIALATAAAVIASQAVITGAYSLTWQAVQLGYLPRMDVLHTSEEEIGQIYIPTVNGALWLATIGLVLGFQSSSNLAAAYGVAVTGTMVITTALMFAAMRMLWSWSLLIAVPVTAFFLAIDLAFFGANIVKIPDGGWFPVLVGALVVLIMTTWRTGRSILRSRLAERQISFEQLWSQAHASPQRVEGTAIYMTSLSDAVPPALVNLLEHTGVLHERILLTTVVIDRVPVVPPERRIEVRPLGHGIYRVVVHCGFVESPNVPRSLEALEEHGLTLSRDRITYVIGRETLLPTGRPGMVLWRERLFAALARNAARPMQFFRIPPEKVLEIGAQIEL